MKNNRPALRVNGYSSNWDEFRMIDLVTPIVREVPKPTTSYKRLSVRSHAKGTFHQVVENPNTIAMDKLYVVHQDDLIVNITFAWEHAIAIAEEKDHDLLVSHRFPTFLINKSDVNFIKYLVTLKSFKNRLDLISPGGAGRNRVLNKKDFNNLKLFAPAQMDEQKKIGLFFKNLDDVISLHQQELEALKQTKQGFLQKMFPQKDATVPEIRFSEFRNEWEAKKLKDVVSLLKDGTHGTHKNGEYAYLLSAKNIKFGKVLLNPDQDRKIAKTDYEQIYKNYELENEDLLVTIVGTIGQTALYYKDDNVIAFQRSVGIIRGNEDVRQLFLKAIFDSNLIQKQLKNSSSISAQPGVYLGDLEKMTLMLPAVDEQIKIGKFFRQLDEVIELKEKEIEALKETKKGFLQKMFV